MKVKKIRDFVKKLGLEHEEGNSFPNVIMNVWWPYRSAGFIMGGKVYDNHVVTEEDCQENHKVFNKLMEFCADNNLQIIEYEQVEYGFISNATIVLRNDNKKLLMQGENETNFEIDDTFEGKKKPLKIDMGPSSYVKPYVMFDTPLKKHEKEKVLSGIVNLLSYHNENGRQQILTNLAKYSGFVEPLITALEEGLLNLTVTIELIMNDDWMYYEREAQAKKLFKVLTAQRPSMLIDLSNGRGYLPDVIVESPMLMRQVCKNWSFDSKTEERVLTFLIQDEHIPALKIFLNNYQPFEVNKYHDNISPFLISIHDNKMVKQYLDNWVELNNHYADFMDDMDTMVVRMNPEHLKYAIEKVLGPNPQHLYNKLVDAFMGSNLYNPFVSKDILILFVDNQEVDLTYGDGYILQMFYNDEKMQQKLLDYPNMIDTLIAAGKEDYLPDTVKDIFLF